MLFSDLNTLYSAHVKGRLRSHRQIAGILGRWCAVIGNKPITGIKRTDVAEWIARRMADGRSANTINCDLAILSGAFNYARRVLEIDVRNPVSGQMLRQPEGRLRYLTPPEAARLIEAAGQVYRKWYVRPFVILTLHTGCRKNEVLHLPWSAVDLAARRITLDRTKNGRRRAVPLNAQAYGALTICAAFRQTHCPTSQWVFCHRDGSRVGDVRRAFTAACRMAELEDFTIHDLRHTFASWLVQRQVQLPEVRDLLGHSSVRMTERYAHLAQESLARAVAVLDSV